MTSTLSAYAVAPAPSAPVSATLAMHPRGSVGVGVRVGGWAAPAAGVLLGGLLLGMPGALAGGVLGYLLVR